ncbi:conserved hypothetical protein, partial [Trichinella spiralis]|uniref:hypothetical protein n=1 Tax=Trichinella spiralis TaxID=6334 RepID=UPI0001EFEFB8
YLPGFRFSFHCNYVQQSHSGFLTWSKVSGPQLTVFGLYLVGRWGLSESQLSLVSSVYLIVSFGMCVPFQNFYQGLPVLRLVVISPEQFRVCGSSEVQPGLCQLSCKE